MADAIKLSEVSPEELEEIQSATLRAHAVSLGADIGQRDEDVQFNLDDEVIIIIVKRGGPPPFPDRIRA
jgi:hypothetical protein